jgi:hypothetical protein
MPSNEVHDCLNRLSRSHPEPHNIAMTAEAIIVWGTVLAVLVGLTAFAWSRRDWALGGPRLSLKVHIHYPPDSENADEIHVDVVNRGRSGIGVQQADLEDARGLGIHLMPHTISPAPELPAEAKANDKLALRYDLRRVGAAFVDHGPGLPRRVRVLVSFAARKPLASGWFSFPRVDVNAVHLTHRPVGRVDDPPMDRKP